MSKVFLYFMLRVIKQEGVDTKWSTITHTVWFNKTRFAKEIMAHKLQ